MDAAFQQMGHSILQTFGQSALLTFADQTTQSTQVILSTEIAEIGKYEAVQGEISLASLEVSIKVKRGDILTVGQSSYEFDRKIKDDGYLATWNIYDYPS